MLLLIKRCEAGSVDGTLVDVYMVLSNDVVVAGGLNLLCVDDSV